MSEKYHAGSCVHFAAGIVTLGPDTIKITINSRVYYFEWHRYFGPSLVKKNGDVPKQPSERHPFWRAVSLWDKQGRRVDAGHAIWSAPQEQP